MVKKNREMTETSAMTYEDSIETQAMVEITASASEQSSFEDLAALLNDLCDSDTIMGYILKNDITAKINLKDSAKVVDFAMLSSQAFDSAAEISASFGVGSINNIVIDGTDIKVLCVNAGENAASVFMEKNTDHVSILNKLLS
jgi:predicted regulator of Ras-like GTPase activity (Roadblock/LC7/MglB family)